MYWSISEEVDIGHTLPQSNKSLFGKYNNIIIVSLKRIIMEL